MREHNLTELVFPSRDVVILWRFASTLSQIEGRLPQTRGFKFQFAIRDFVTHYLKYIPYLTSRMVGLSGVIHQYDSVFLRRLVIKGHKDLLFLESKWHAQRTPSDRHDVMIFNQKAFDVYYRLRNEGRNIDLYRIFVSSVPLGVDAFKFCLAHGILVIQPYKKGQSLESIEVSINMLEKALLENPTERIQERNRLIDSLYRFRERIFWGCSSIGGRIMENGEVLFNRYRELLARVHYEVS